MIVTKNTFVCYTLLRGTMSLQVALFAISLYCILAFPDAKESPLITNITAETFVLWTEFYIPLTHGLLIITGILVDVLKIERVKSMAQIIGMLLILNLLCILTILMTALPQDIAEGSFSLQAFFFWFKIELVCSIGLIFSLALYMSLRSCCRNKV